jgi:hypothetical protein
MMQGNKKITKLIGKTYCIIILLFVISILTNLSSCYSKSQNKEKDFTTNNNDFQLEFSVFEKIPKQIDSCKCLFSSDKKNFNLSKYIFLTDFLVTSYVKLNGVIIKFIMLNNEYENHHTSTVTYKSNGYEMKVKIFHQQKDKYKGLKTGQITIKASNRREITKEIYGVCGCNLN